MKRFLLLVLLISHVFLPPAAKAQAPASAACADTGQPPTTFTLDGIALELCSTFIANPRFVVSDPASAIQIAYATQTGADYRELLITAVRYGSRAPTELLARASASTADDDYRAQLRADRTQQGGHPQRGVVLRLFGHAVAGDTSSVPLALDGIHAQSVQVTEWEIKAANRLWIVRASQPDSGPGAAERIVAGSAALAKTSLSGSAVTAGSASIAGLVPIQPAVSPLSVVALATPNPRPIALYLPGVQNGRPDLPAPAWWSGACDNDRYILSTDNPQHLPAYALGAVYRGLVACGPRPWADGAPDVMVRFFPGAWGELEWECVELSMRFLYLAYGIAPYAANGNRVVANYQGTQLVKYSNGQPGTAPQPDDVLSYCATCTYGHTSVVTAAAVDDLGNGSITVIEENNSPTGFSTLPVSNWVVSGNSGPVTGWLRAAP